MIEKELPASDKISKKLLDVAEWFIHSCKSQEECEMNVMVAKDSWNIACLERELIDSAVKEALIKYGGMFNLNEVQIKVLENNIRSIIKKKRNMYPKENIVIATAKIRFENGVFNFDVQAIDKKKLEQINES